MQLVMKPKKTSRAPVKKTINLAGYNEKKPNYLGLILGVVLIAAVAFAVAKFGVIDRYMNLEQAKSRVTSLETEINAAKQEITRLEGITDDYAHYTYSGMTADELSLVSRPAVTELLDRVVLSKASTTGWTLTGNTVVINITQTSLSTLNEIAEELKEDRLVSYCTVYTAQTTDDSDGNGEVAGSVTIYLQIPEEEEEARS